MNITTRLWKIIVLLFITSFSYALKDTSMAISNSDFYESIKDSRKIKINNTDKKWIYSLRRYRNFITEGENLSVFCRKNPKVYYRDPWLNDQVKNSFYATLQMIIFENTIPAIAKYAKMLEISSEKYEVMYKNIMAHSCSTNNTVMSKRLINYLFRKYYKDNNYQLPSIDGNPLFSQRIIDAQSKEEKALNELTYTIGLFKAACSWGGKYEFPRLLEGIVKNPVVAAYIVRQLSSKVINMREDNDQIITINSSKTTKVFCDGLICRKRDNVEFEKLMPFSLGSVDLNRDMKAMYCSQIVNAVAEVDPKVDDNFKEIIKEYSGHKKNRLVGQFISMITKIPDFNVWTNSPKLLDKYLKLSLDEFWSSWANNYLETYKKRIEYEEPLVLRKVPDNMISSEFDFKPILEYDLDSGEFDSAIKRNGKVSFSFHVKIPTNEMEWLFSNVKYLNFDDYEDIEKIKVRLRAHIEKDFSKVQKMFEKYFIKGDFLTVLTDDFYDHLRFYKKITSQIGKNKYYKVPIIINVSPFALTYINNKQVIENGLKYELLQEKNFKTEERIDSMAQEKKE